jgi:hypothetical protein
MILFPPAGDVSQIAAARSVLLRRTVHFEGMSGEWQIGISLARPWQEETHGRQASLFLGQDEGD